MIDVANRPGVAQVWTAAERWPSLDGGELHLWRAHPSAWAGRECELCTLLDPDELLRADRFRFAADRIVFVTTRALLRCLLGHYLGVDSRQVRFAVGIAGKPCVLLPPRTSVMEFNVSHSADVALMAVTRSGPIGVDVERQLDDVEYADVVDRFFSRSEQAAFWALHASSRRRSFFAGWTRKEAYIKATGLGVSAGLDYFDVSIAADGEAELLADRRDPAATARWCMLDVSVGDGYSAALVIPAGCPTVRYWDIGAASQLGETRSDR